MQSIFTSTTTRIVSACLQALALGSCRVAPLGDAPLGSHLADDGAFAEVSRTVAPRLTIPLAYATCAAADGDTIRSGAMCDSRTSPAPAPRAILELAAHAAASIARAPSVEALHTAALIDLLWSDDSGNSLDRSIQYLHAAATLGGSPAPVLGDLAAAHMVRAKRRDNSGDLLLALESAHMAVERDSRNPTALFNFALALQELGLNEESLKAWSAYRAVDSTSLWADEAGRHASFAASLIARQSAPDLGASPAEVADYAARYPQEARELGWNHVLGEWGASILRDGPTPRSDSLLAFAESLGVHLATRGGDRSLARAVRDIRRHAPSSAATREVARAHADYAEGQRQYRDANYGSAMLAFAAAARAPRSSTLAEWSNVFRAVCLVYLRQTKEGQALLRQVLSRADTTNNPALVARARWGLGATMLRSGRHEGLAFVRAAQSLFRSVRELEYLGATESLEGEEYLLLGDVPSAYARLRAALLTLRPYSRSVWRHGALYALQLAAARDDHVRAATLVQNEGLAVADRISLPYYGIEARLVRARLRIARADSAAAVEELEAIRPRIAALPPSAFRARFEADWQLSYAAAALSRRPREAVTLLDSAIRFFVDNDNPALLLPALLRRANAFLALKQTALALGDFERALDLLSLRGRAIADAPLRASLLDNAQAVFDRVAMFQLAEASPADGLFTLERGRTSLMSLTRAVARPSSSHFRAPPNAVVLEYALIADTLVTWAVHDSVVSVTRLTVQHDTLRRRIERVRSSLELLSTEAITRPDLEALYEVIIRPVERQIPPNARIVIIADADMGRVPFSALYDARRTRYLLEEHAVQYANSLGDVTMIARHEPQRDATALIVADPAGTTRLPDARGEAVSISRNYGVTEVLEDTMATRERVLAALRAATVFHFAGHAVFDDVRPERSYLALAGREPHTERLTADEVSRLHLDQVRLVVLSSCETMPGRSTSSGLAGLSGALLAAGAKGVVGSLWRVDDRLTRSLMTELHRQYVATGDGAEALRAAQLALLHSTEPTRRSPAAWAAFRYAGE